MKHLLKPTGQILTTAVFTSTAMNAAIPNVAIPLPLDTEFPETDPTPETPTVDASNVTDQGETIAPPETVSSYLSFQSGTISPLPEEFFVDLMKNKLVSESAESQTIVAPEDAAGEISSSPTISANGEHTHHVAQPAIEQPASLPYHLDHRANDQDDTVQSKQNTASENAIPTAQIGIPETALNSESALTLDGKREAAPDSLDEASSDPTVSSPETISPEPNESKDQSISVSDELVVDELVDPETNRLIDEMPLSGLPDLSDSKDVIPSNENLETDPLDISPQPNQEPDNEFGVELQPDVSNIERNPKPDFGITLDSDGTNVEEPFESNTEASFKSDTDDPEAHNPRTDDIPTNVDLELVSDLNSSESGWVEGRGDDLEHSDNADSDSDDVIANTTVGTDVDNLERFDEVDADTASNIESNAETDLAKPVVSPESEGIDKVEEVDESEGGEVINVETETMAPKTIESETNEVSDESNALQETRDWLDAQLAVIVEQSRDRQAFEGRQRLIEHVRQLIEMGDLGEARRTAENPILLPKEREALLVAIETHQSNSFIPLIPPDDQLELIGIQPSLPFSPPVGTDVNTDLLPVLPTTPLSLPNTIYTPPEITSSDQLPSLPLVSLGLHQWPQPTFRGLPAPTSLTVEELRNCLLGGAKSLLQAQDSLQDAIADPSASLMTPLTTPSINEPMTYIGVGQQPPSVAKSSEQFPIGGSFLAGVGQQPPSILPDSSWAGLAVLSAEPVAMKWTRARLNAELEAIAALTTPDSPATNCEETLVVEHDDDQLNTSSAQIGGRTVANLTGYEWLSQFSLSRPQSTPQQAPAQMILPLPTAAPMTSKFGWRSHPIYGGRRFHFGLDYGAPMGTPILASIPGQVVTTGLLDGYGFTVIVENEALGLRTLYAHMSGIGVQEGREVEQGAVLGWVGSTGNSTGPHLHFEVHKKTSEGWVAMDPLRVAAELVGPHNVN